MALSSPNAMIWSTFRSMARISDEINGSSEENYIKDKVAISIVLCVTAVETFINIFFRNLVEEDKYKEHKEMILKDLDSEGNGKPKGLKYKLNTWPNQVLNKNIDFNKEPSKLFEEIRQKRNSLMHFTSRYETVTVPGIQIKGLADTGVFDNLNKTDGLNTVIVARDFMAHILSLAGVSREKLPHVMHHWTGMAPEIEVNSGI